MITYSSKDVNRDFENIKYLNAMFNSKRFTELEQKFRNNEIEINQLVVDTIMVFISFDLMEQSKEFCKYLLEIIEPFASDLSLRDAIRYEIIKTQIKDEQL